MKKRILKILCVFSALFVLFFSGCSKGGKTAVTVNEAEVSNGVYAYYIDKVLSYPDEYAVNEEGSEGVAERDAVTETALGLCRNFVAADMLMSDLGLSVSQQLKSEVAENTENIWSLFGEYYKSIDVSKSDITKINTFEAQKMQLLDYYYGKGGKNEVSDDDLKQKFVEMYIGFKCFEGTFTKVNVKGETVEMTEKEKENTISEFRKMAQRVDGGESIDDVYADYCSGQGLVATSELEVIVMKENDPMYADDFFSKVSTISHGRAAPVTSGSSIYVVERCTIASSDEDAFEKYRTEVLEEMKMSAIEKKIAKKVQYLNSVLQEDMSVKIYNTVSAVHEEKKAQNT